MQHAQIHWFSMLNNEIEAKGSTISVPHLFVQSGHQDFLQLTMLICTCWKGVPKIPSEIREYKVVSVLRTLRLRASSLVCSISTTRRVKEGLNHTHLLHTKLPSTAVVPEVSNPRFRLKASFTNTPACCRSWAKHVSEHGVTSSKTQVALTNSNTVMKTEVVIHPKLLKHRGGSAASAIYATAAFLPLKARALLFIATTSETNHTRNSASLGENVSKTDPLLSKITHILLLPSYEESLREAEQCTSVRHTQPFTRAFLQDQPSTTHCSTNLCNERDSICFALLSAQMKAESRGK